jgi:hypothetical protein
MKNNRYVRNTQQGKKKKLTAKSAPKFFFSFIRPNRRTILYTNYSTKRLLVCCVMIIRQYFVVLSH